MDSNRKTAFQTLLAIDEERAYSNLALNHLIAQNQPSSPGLVRELVYGVLKNQILLDHQISHYLRTPISKVDPKALLILRMGFYQLGMLSGIPAYAAINESVLLAKKFCHGQDRFVNGVLRNYARRREDVSLPSREKDPVQYLSLRYSFPIWLVRFWLEQFDPVECEQLLSASNQQPPMTIRANLLRTTRKELKEVLEEQGFQVREGVHVPESLSVTGSALLETAEFRKGWFSVQDESSMLAVHTLDPHPGEQILDLCAAPGGKTLFLAERMKNQGRILAGDLHPHKLELIRQAAERNGITIVETRCHDATSEDPALFAWADRILVDAPCSGLGVLRRKPEIKYRDQSQAIPALAKIQSEILAAAAPMLKSGGQLLYSTCTISPMENQQVVDGFLRSHKDFRCRAQRQLYPHLDGTDGFFICLMEKG